jgi:CHAT domain-containing protein
MKIKSLSILIKIDKNTVLILFLLLLNHQAFTQENYQDSCFKNLEIAFETSNWEKVISQGKSIMHEFKINKLKQEDSLKIIQFFDASYKMIIAYTWLERKDSAQLLFENFNIKHELFVNQLNYSNYYRLAAEACIQFVNNKSDEAEVIMKKAYDLAFNNLRINKPLYFDAVKNLVIYYIETSGYDKAIAVLYKAMLAMEEQKPDASFLAEFYYYLYLVYYSESNYKLALENSQKGMEELQLTENDEDNYLYARLLLAVGASYFQMQEYHTSLEFLHKALDIQLNNYCNKNPDLAMNYNYLGRVYRKLDNLDLAIEYKRKASAIYKNIYQSDNHFRVSFINYSLSIYFDERVNRKIADFDPELYEALNKFDYVFTYLPVTYPLSNNPLWIYQFTTQAFIYSKLKEYDKSVSYLQQALNVKQQKNGINKVELINFYLLIGQGFYNNNQFDSANYFYQMGIKSQINGNGSNYTDSIVNVSFSNGPTPSLIKLLYLNARCYEAIADNERNENKEKNYQLALNYYIKCDKLAEEFWFNIRKREDKLFLGQQMDGVYKAALNVCFELSAIGINKIQANNYLVKAFYFSQKSKSNLLEELITKSGAGKYAGIPDSLLNKELKLRNNIAFWERHTQRKIVRDPNDYDHILIYYRKLIDKSTFNKTSFSDSLFKYTKQYEQLIDYYNVNYPRYFDLKYSKNVHSIGEIQDKLDNNSVMLDYHVKGKSIDIFLISNDGFHAKRVIFDEPIDSLINVYRMSISGYYRKEDFINKGFDDFIKNGIKLYEYLIKPIEDQIKNKNKLIIIVSEQLSLLPFETLIAGNAGSQGKDLANLDYLIKKYDVVYNYSGNLWMNSLTKSAAYNKEPDNLLAMAPVFDPDKMNIELGKPVRDIFYSGKMGGIDLPDLSPLPATRNAVEEICELANNKQINAMKFLYDRASKNEFRLEVANKKYVLIATHGHADNENPKFSGLYFAPLDSLNQLPENVFLYSNEIYNLNLISDLMVLYACETGVGQVKKGEGVMTISRGFMASGVANIVHTLWSIQDASTKELVVDMFKGVFEKKTYSGSLRQAKLKMIDCGVIPFHWAGLVLLGN